MEICEHLAKTRLTVRTVLDATFGLAEAVTQCGACNQTYLLELLDVRGEQRAYRVTSVAPEIADALLHNLAKGSCDLKRAEEEVHAVRTLTNPPTHWVATTAGDLQVQRLEVCIDLPTAPWRNLPLDGRWLTENTADAHASG